MQKPDRKKVSRAELAGYATDMFFVSCGRKAVCIQAMVNCAYKYLCELVKESLPNEFQ